MSTRYVYAGVLSSLFFIIIYGILDIFLLLSIIISIIVFIAFILIYKEKDVRKYDPKLMLNYSYQISKIYNLANDFGEGTLQKRLFKIVEIAEKILLLIESRSNKVEQAYNFFDYYLTITIKILLQYQIDIKNESNDIEKDTLKVEEHIKKIEIAFEKQLKNMNQIGKLNLEADIRVFEKTLKMDGFIDDMKDVENEDGK